jgi:hypothetical protein
MKTGVLLIILGLVFLIGPGEIIGLVIGLFGLVFGLAVGLIGGIFGVVVGLGAAVLALAIPLIILGAIGLALLKLIFA